MTADITFRGNSVSTSRAKEVVERFTNTVLGGISPEHVQLVAENKFAMALYDTEALEEFEDALFNALSAIHHIKALVKRCRIEQTAGSVQNDSG